MNNGAVCVGMDLGTCKIAIASSNGRREVMDSAVGWPKDLIANRLIGREVVFGKEVAKQRLALDVVRPFQKGAFKYLDHAGAGVPAGQVEKHQQAARLLVEHAVSLAKLPEGVRVFGVIGAPARAAVDNKQVLLEAARESLHAVLIVSEPFGVDYGMDCLKNTLMVDIGGGTVDICAIFGTLPEENEQITLSTGGEFIDEEFLNQMKEANPRAQLSLRMAREIKERYGFVHDANEHAVVTIPEDGKPKEMDVTAPLKEACKSIVQPIIRGIEELVARLDPEFQHCVLENIVLCGGGSQLRGLDRLIEEGLHEYGRVKVSRVNDAVFAGAAGALKMAMDIPEDYWSQLKALDQTHKAAAA